MSTIKVSIPRGAKDTVAFCRDKTDARRPFSRGAGHHAQGVGDVSFETESCLLLVSIRFVSRSCDASFPDCNPPLGGLYLQLFHKEFTLEQDKGPRNRIVSIRSTV